MIEYVTFALAVVAGLAGIVALVIMGLDAWRGLQRKHAASRRVVL